MIRRTARVLALATALVLAACSPEPQPANPALWRVDGPAGGRAWLFGTIHSLPRPTVWRTSAVARAFDDSDRIVVEIAGLDQRGVMQHTFAMLAHTPGQPPLGERKMRWPGVEPYEGGYHGFFPSWREFWERGGPPDADVVEPAPFDEFIQRMRRDAAPPKIKVR